MSFDPQDPHAAVRKSIEERRTGQDSVAFYVSCQLVGGVSDLKSSDPSLTGLIINDDFSEAKDHRRRITISRHSDSARRLQATITNEPKGAPFNPATLIHNFYAAGGALLPKDDDSLMRSIREKKSPFVVINDPVRKAKRRYLNFPFFVVGGDHCSLHNVKVIESFNNYCYSDSIKIDALKLEIKYEMPSLIGINNPYNISEYKGRYQVASNFFKMTRIFEHPDGRKVTVAGYYRLTTYIFDTDGKESEEDFLFRFYKQVILREGYAYNFPCITPWAFDSSDVRIYSAYPKGDPRNRIALLRVRTA